MNSLFRLLSFLLRLSSNVQHSRLRIFGITVAGVASGLATTGMIALINAIITGPQSRSSQRIWGFVALCVALPACRFASQVLLVDLSQSSLLTLRLRLSRLVLSAPLRQLEAIGASRLLATLTTDIGTIADSMSMVPLLIMHTTLILSSLVYMGWLDARLLLEVALFIVGGILTYRLAAGKALRFFDRSRRGMDEVFSHIRAMVEGTKELKMHRARRLSFLRNVERSTTAQQKDQKSGQIVFSAASSWGQVLFFILTGFIILFLPRFQTLDPKILVGYIIVLFQMMAPLEVLMTAIPSLSRGTVAIQTVETLGFSLETEELAPEQEAAAGAPTWELLELTGVVHHYRQENDESFLLGPIDLKFRPGELVFLVGGNGSGKTTLAKILIGLYAPEAGQIRFNGDAIVDSNRERYRESFSVVFSDFFLFEDLLGLESARLDQDALRYLERLQLNRKVRVEQGRLSTLALSQGQRKRLALMTAYLEDRSIYLFDEWAADQDPTFKQVFYLELLPELRRRGKTLFIISHDDQYFHVADRIIKLNYGQVEYDRSIAEHQSIMALPTTA
jgi:putative ATP-binding cassette transporter